MNAPAPLNPPVTISPVKDIVAEMAAGRMVILIDEEDRENEGDLVLAADHVSAETINFMAKHGRGKICDKTINGTSEECTHSNAEVACGNSNGGIGRESNDVSTRHNIASFGADWNRESGNNGSRLVIHADLTIALHNANGWVGRNSVHFSGRQTLDFDSAVSVHDDVVGGGGHSCAGQNHGSRKHKCTSDKRAGPQGKSHPVSLRHIGI